MIVPDIAGFRAAQQRLRELLGTTVTFLIPEAATWAAGEPIDPETGRPMDPFAEPATGGGLVEVTKRVSFVARPLTSGRALGGDVAAAPIGNVDMGSAALIVDVADYPDVEDATRVHVGQALYDIENWRFDTLGEAERWIAYLEKS
jgi:hypothetical protein